MSTTTDYTTGVIYDVMCIYTRGSKYRIFSWLNMVGQWVALLSQSSNAYTE